MALVAAILGVGYAIEDQINIIGDFADVVQFATTIALYIVAAWAVRPSRQQEGPQAL
jgi:hypothetical protein